MIRRILTAAVFLASVTAGHAQTPATPASRLAFEIDPGRIQSGTTTAPRPIANVAFQFRVDGGAPVAAVLDTPCVPFGGTPAGQFTCHLRLPTLAEGPHTLEVRGLPSPAESGVGPGAYSPSLSVAMILVTVPGIPQNGRVEPAVP